MINKTIYKQLIKIAEKQTTISYSQLAADCNIPYTAVDERNKFHDMLGDISKFEVKNNRPMLSCLVHHKGDIERTPGNGFFNLATELNVRKQDEPDTKAGNKKLLYRQIEACWGYWK